MLKVLATSVLALTCLSGAGFSQPVKIIDRDTGEVFGPFDMSSDREINISGRSYLVEAVHDVEVSLDPEGILKSYLSTSNWPDRLQYVIRSDGIADRMRIYYHGPIPKPISVSVSSTGEKFRGQDGTLIVLGTRDFSSPNLPKSQTDSYLMRLVDGKWLVDWDGTYDLAKDEQEARANSETRALGLSDAKLEVQTLRLKARSDYTYVEAAIKNSSDAEISRLSIAFSLYDEVGKYISQGSIHHSGIKPGVSVVVTSPSDTGKNSAKTVRYEVKSVDIYNAAGTPVRGVEKYFELIQD